MSSMSNTSVNTSFYSLYFNNNTTDTNYYIQNLYASSTSVGGERANSSRMLGLTTTSKSIDVVKFKLTNSGYIVYQCNSTKPLSSAVEIGCVYATTTFTATSVTEVRVTGSVANSIGIGSRFQLYKIN